MKNLFNILVHFIQEKIYFISCFTYISAIDGVNIVGLLYLSNYVLIGLHYICNNNPYLKMAYI